MEDERNERKDFMTDKKIGREIQNYQCGHSDKANGTFSWFIFFQINLNNSILEVEFSKLMNSR